MADEVKQQPERIPQIGEHIIFTDSVGVDHDALVQCVWGPRCLNLIIVSGDDKKTDQYGRQIEHYTSMNHVAPELAYGYYWRYPGEQPNSYKPPLAK
jgi:hypothetical protein